MNEETVNTTPAQPSTPAMWALVEVMGHRHHYGLVSQVEMFGAPFARIDIFRTGDKEPRGTHFYGGASIFSINPLTEQDCRERATPYSPPALSFDEDGLEDEESF